MKTAGFAVLFAALALGSLSLGCVLDAPCGCGQTFVIGPSGGGDPGELVPASHTRGAHCTCHCGGVGAEVRLPPSRDCDEFEIACTDDDGTESTFVCFGGVR
jgi:hypothetical protein